MKAARAVAAPTPRLAETLAHDWRKAAMLYAQYGITETQFRHGVPLDSPGSPSPASLADALHATHKG